MFSDDPFGEAAAFVADETGAFVSPERVIERLQEWKRNGVLRRFGAMVMHRKIGFNYNGMTIWDVPDECKDKLGAAFAAMPFVSHCYARKRKGEWPYNLYAMAHAASRDELQEHVTLMRDTTGFEPRVLVSTKEYKKASPVYFQEKGPFDGTC